MNEEPNHRALYGFLIASAIFTVLLYAVLFQMRSDSITNCEQRNDQMREVNSRAPVLNTLIRFEQDETDEHSAFQLQHLEALQAKHVSLSNCSDTFSKPWPFG